MLYIIYTDPYIYFISCFSCFLLLLNFLSNSLIKIPNSRSFTTVLILLMLLVVLLDWLYVVVIRLSGKCIVFLAKSCTYGDNLDRE